MPIKTCERHPRITFFSEGCVCYVEAHPTAPVVPVTTPAEQLAVIERLAADAARGFCVERMSYGPSAAPGAAERHEQS